MFNYLKLLAILFVCLTLFSCASVTTQSELDQGERLFKEGYYKKSMQQLLPLAVEGNAKAQYAVGYMYYYGYGVPQDTETGRFWINRAASQQYSPAIIANNAIIKNRKVTKRP